MNEPTYGELIEISVDKISPHRDNPRKNLGDLTELSDSIRANGVLQNLTVVPRYEGITREFTDQYYVVIGHRRLAAAKMAGQKTVPCIVSKMTAMEQVRTMVTENMQRADLTVYEQAQAIQLMMDMGDTLRDISKYTGLSATTVRRRAKLLELDQELLKESVITGATLMDYAELDKISDPALRNEALAQIGTNNYAYAVQAAIKKEQIAQNKIKLIDFLAKFAEKTEKQPAGAMYCKYFYNFELLDYTTPPDAGQVDYYYTVDDRYNGVKLYRDKSAAEVAAETTRKESMAADNNARKARLDALANLADICYTLRRNFVKKITPKQATELYPVVIEELVSEVVDGYGIRVNPFDKEALMYDLYPDLFAQSEDGSVFPQIKKCPELYLLILLYETYDTQEEIVYGYYGDYRPGYAATLGNTYAYLKKIGYEMSDEEEKYLNGTHELFKKEETEN